MSGRRKRRDKAGGLTHRINLDADDQPAEDFPMGRCRDPSSHGISRNPYCILQRMSCLRNHPSPLLSSRTKTRKYSSPRQPSTRALALALEFALATIGPVCPTWSSPTESRVCASLCWRVRAAVAVSGFRSKRAPGGCRSVSHSLLAETPGRNARERRGKNLKEKGFT